MRRTLTVLGLLATSFAGPLLAAGTAQAAELDASLPPCVAAVVNAAAAVRAPGALVTVTGGNVTVHGAAGTSYVYGVEGPAAALVTRCDF
ncbi:MAG: hypothetical protein QOE05_217 [Actinomycetota bacterium]|jgi:hypothetical protein|nr:hypothetical protein [Actinomycetota bacterium]